MIDIFAKHQLHNQRPMRDTRLIKSDADKRLSNSDIYSIPTSLMKAVTDTRFTTTKAPCAMKSLSVQVGGRDFRF